MAQKKKKIDIYGFNGSAQKKKAFLAAYGECGNIAVASRAAQISRHRHYDWLEKDEEYVKQFKAAGEQAADFLEAEARRRAVNGKRRLKLHSGKPYMDPETGKPYYDIIYSDVLLIFLLKGIRPEKYRERYDHTSKGESLAKKVYIDI